MKETQEKAARKAANYITKFEKANQQQEKLKNKIEELQGQVHLLKNYKDEMFTLMQ